jgi:PAS domain S-box-containing protein
LDQPLLDHLIATGPVVCVSRTPQGAVTFVSPNVERILGHAPADVMGDTDFWVSHVHPDDRDRFVAEEKASFERGATELERDIRFQHADGAYRWLHVRTLAEVDDAGSATAILDYAVDRTEQRSIEDQNAQLFGFPLALVFIAGMDGFFKRVGAGYERMLGWTEEELLSRPFVEFVHPDDLPALGAALQEMASGGTEVINQELRALCKDGSYRWLMGNYRAVMGEGVMYGMAVDVTDRRNTEDALRESEGRTRLILDTAYEAFISIDLEGRIIDWNAEAERVLGWTREEVLGCVLADTIVPQRYRGDHVRGLERFRATGEGPVLGRVLRMEALRRDGSEFPVEFTISPIRIDHTTVFNAFLRDVTERKRAEDAVTAARAEAEAARDEAEQANRAKSEFLARMSHELRTPLNAILGFAQLLEIGQLPSEHAESVGQILHAGRHLLNLIEEVIDVARIEQGRLSLSIEPIPLGEVLGEALDLVRPLAASAGIPISADLSQFRGHAFADRQRLKQVFMNLLSNAIKYNREGGDINVTCGPVASGRIRVAVADTGEGIPEEQMDRLFLPFERLGAERTTIEGTGIGLSIAKRLTELMGGTIGAQSELGRGSTFWVELDPAEPPESATEAAEAVPAAAPGSDGERTVLYVEDNLPNLRLVERILARRPHAKLIAAMQGGLALELAREHRPALILLDVHLPDIDGDEVLRRLRADADTRDIPVVTVSAEATPKKIERFLSAGARAYLTKPLDVKRFLEVVDGILAESPG